MTPPLQIPSIPGLRGISELVEVVGSELVEVVGKNIPYQKEGSYPYQIIPEAESSPFFD